MSYGLDPVGNRTSQSSSLHGISSLGFSYNADDQILGETYDANGNTTATGGKTFAYDSENRLVSMNGGAVTMVYDGDGNRVAKTANGSTTRYLVDDLNPTGYSQVVEETVNGAATREYTYGLQRIDEDQIVNNAWTPSFYGYDGFGTVRQLTSLAGAVTDTFEYDAFGNEITHTGTTQNNYLYRGEQWDPDLGLYYLRARYYNPQTGRFMSRDPHDGNIKIPGTLHKYLYAAADPVTYIDPSGQDGELAGYIDLSARSLTMAQRVASYGCYASLALTGTSLLLTKHLGAWDLAGAAATAYGCVTLSLPTTAESAAGKVALGFKKALDYGTCALSLATIVHDLNEYANSEPEEKSPAPFFVDTFGAVVGCVSTQLGTELEAEEE